MMLLRRWFARGLVAVALLCGAGTGTASVVVPMSLEQLAREAHLVVDGRVIAVHATADTGRIERVVSVRVLGRWKGDPGEVVHVRLPGGTIGRTQTIVPGAPSLSEGDRLVLFLHEITPGAYRVLGLHQGAWRVSASPVNGRLQVGPSAAGGVSGGRLQRGDGTRRPRPLDAFRADVLALLEASR